jgi:hypothetical protein
MIFQNKCVGKSASVVNDGEEKNNKLQQWKKSDTENGHERDTLSWQLSAAIGQSYVGLIL